MISTVVLLLHLGLDLIEKLQQHENPEIYKLSYDIIEQFFSEVRCVVASVLFLFHEISIDHFLIVSLLT